MNYILFDNDTWNNLLPLTYTRPVAKIRIGILTISEKWEKLLNNKVSYFTKDYLSKKFPIEISNDNILINSSIVPDDNIINEINSLKVNESLIYDNSLLAIRLGKDISNFDYKKIDSYNSKIYTKEVFKIDFLWDIFQFNGKAIALDFNIITRDRQSQEISKTNNILGKENIFIEEGAKVEFATINATDAYVYIGKDAEIMEGCVVRGSLALCEHSVLKMAAKIYGPTTIGPYSKAGGEVNNTVITGYSSKAHDGFLGNSVIGEWCNLGADTNNSNLKNNYAEVKLWSYKENSFVSTGLQFCGLIMGDHSKCGINTMFNTGTVIGVNSNIFGEGFPRNFIPSFAWGGAYGFVKFKLKNAFDVAQLVMSRRNKNFDITEQEILEKVYELTAEYRSFGE
ncbi:MAG: GlmU family protein [Bacteroidales bacterium]|jgi:UDP-N-acetylglucosamine diphosphorylase/glucosamine-1-phosphate N-acetyltransferase|nr:GlmU family protein [Bacteroidales bacterium]